MSFESHIFPVNISNDHLKEQKPTTNLSSNCIGEESFMIDNDENKTKTSKHQQDWTENNTTINNTTQPSRNCINNSSNIQQCIAPNNNTEMNNNGISSSPTMINHSQDIQSTDENRTRVKTQSKLFSILNFPILIIISILNGIYSLFMNSWEYMNSIFSRTHSKKKKQRKSKDNDNSAHNISTSSNSSSSLPPLGFFSILSGRISRSNSNVEKPTQSKKFLILDLDETLIHASTTPPRTDHERLYNYILDVQIDHVNCTFYVSERPHLKLFMEKVCEWYNVVIFTASVKNYANPVIDRLYHSEKIVQRLFRSSCYVTEHGVYIKDLKTVTDDLTKCMIIDNSPISYMWYQENAIPISNWMGDNERDRALLNLLPFLEAMRHLEDVKSILSFRIGL